MINEKTVAALSEDGKYETAQFIKHFDRIWKFVNTKHPESHIRLNDPDRRPFQSVDDYRLQIMKETAEIFERWEEVLADNESNL